MAEIDREAIVKELVELPEDTDSRDWPWIKKIVYELNQSRLWSDICIDAFNRTDSPALKIWFLLEHVNGWRRQLGKWDMKVAFEALEEIKFRISQLPDSYPRKDRLIELWLYHSGWVYHPAGEFSKAADCHLVAAKRAAVTNNKWGMACGSFNAYYERLNAAIIANKGIAEEYGKFRKAAYDFLAVLTGDDDNDIRWRANVFCHLAFYDWVVEGKYPGEEDIAFLDELPNQLRLAFADAAVVLRALFKFPDSRQRSMEITTRLGLTAEVEWYSFAILVRISALEKMGKMEETRAAKEELDRIFENRHGGHLAWAILKHDLLK